MTTNKRKPISTDKQLASLKPEDKPYDVRFAGIAGLFCTIGKRTKTFKYDRGAGHKPRKIVYGNYPELSLKRARELHETTQIQHQNKTLGIANTAVPKTVKELADLFYEKRIAPVRRRPEAVRQVLDHDVIPVIGDMNLQGVTVMVCRMVVEKVVDRGAVTHAGKSLQCLKQMFKFAGANGLMSTNPAEALEPNTLGIVLRIRDRVLSDAEIVLFWQHLENTNSLVSRVALQLLLLLGLRSGELRLTKWTDVGVKNKTLTIPVENQKLKPDDMKSAKPWVVPLSDFALGLLLKLQGLSEEYVFAGRNNNTPLGADTLHRVTSRIVKNLEVEQFKPHDLRRTVRTRLAKLDVDYVVAEKCLNHSLGKIAQTYDHHDYLDERRAALLKWSDYVERLTGSNVVQLRRSA